VSEGYLLGIDIGTSESKGVVTTVTGRLVAAASRAHRLRVPRAGWAEHDADEDWWGGFCYLVRRLLDQSGVDPNHLAGVGCSTIGPCLLPLDAEGKPLRRAILYGIDTRAVREIEELNREIGEQEIFDRCGNDLSAQSVGPKIRWLEKNEPEVWRRTRRLVGGTAYLNWKLGGRWVIDHYSASTFTPLYDLRTLSWSRDVAPAITPLSRLPDIAWTTEIAGTISRSASEETGLPEGLPFITGTIDAAAEAISVGVCKPGRMMVMYGSTMFMILVVDRSVTDSRLWAAPFLFPGTHALMAGMSTSGALTQWFRDQLAKELIQPEGEEYADPKRGFELLAGEAGNVRPGSDGIVVLPYFSGERTPINDPLARGVFFGLTLAHSRAHLYRAVLESVAYGVRHHLEVFRERVTSPLALYAVGGGTKNRLWLQIVSDVCRMPQILSKVSMGACYGDAFLAGLGTGAVGSLSDLSSWVSQEEAIDPDLSSEEAYGLGYRTYRELYERTRDLMARSC